MANLNQRNRNYQECFSHKAKCGFHKLTYGKTAMDCVGECLVGFGTFGFLLLATIFGLLVK